MKAFEVLKIQEGGISERVAQRRLAKAIERFGEPVVKKIIGLALYWLGVKRILIAQVIETPLESLRTFVRVVHRDGLCALEDRRRKGSTFLPVQEPTVQAGTICVEKSDGDIVIDCRGVTQKLVVPAKNKLQVRTVLLTLSAAGLVDLGAVAETIGVSRAYAGMLMKKMAAGDAVALSDQRTGQKHDYRVDEQTKGELLLQWALNAATGKSTSSTALAQDLQERCEVKVSDRTLRTHLKRMGVGRLGGKLAKLVGEVKKGS